ncbi:HAD family hydrolase [bacterium]|nr:HAD family hydrolase [bacterium]
MIEAVFFDIDNTLILFEESELFGNYMQALSSHFSAIMPPDIFLKKTITSSQNLLKNRGQKPNMDFFLDYFCQDITVSREKTWQIFENYYQTEYDNLRTLVKITPAVRQTLQLLANDGQKLVLASNPMFPELVQRMRANWAGLENVKFDFVSSIENASFCKPQPEYYLEICQKINIAPENALMVGDDPINDLAAADSGLKTFLTTDSKTGVNAELSLSHELRSGINATHYTPTASGRLSEVPAFIETLNSAKI